MTPFDDRNDDPLPEELESQNQALTRALSRAYQRSEQLTAAEQGESVARVRERLLLAHRPAQQEDVSEQQTGTADSTPLNPIMPTTFKPQRRIVRFVNGLAAVLVIGAIIGASVLLFTRHTSPTTAIRKLPAGSSDTSGLTVVASSTADGLTMSLAITPGPYFLSEMLAVKVTLTNNSQKNAYPGLPFSGGSFGYYPGVELTYTGNAETRPDHEFLGIYPSSAERTVDAHISGEFLYGSGLATNLSWTYFSSRSIWESGSGCAHSCQSNDSGGSSHPLQGAGV